jgi:hypothetical protein
MPKSITCNGQDWMVRATGNGHGSAHGNPGIVDMRELEFTSSTGQVLKGYIRVPDGSTPNLATTPDSELVDILEFAQKQVPNK